MTADRIGARLALSVVRGGRPLTVEVEPAELATTPG